MKYVKLLNHHCDGFLFKSTCTKSKIITSVNYRKELAEFHIEKKSCNALGSSKYYLFVTAS